MKLRRDHLHPFELVALAMCGLAYVVLSAGGFAPDSGSFAYIVKNVGQRLPGLLVAGLVCQLVAAAFRSDLKGYLRAAFSRPSLVLLARAWLALTAVTWAYTFVKASAPILNERLFDAELERLDRIVHFGLSPTVLLVELTRGTIVSTLLDVWYLLWLTTILVFQSATFWSASLAKRKNFLVGCAALWLAGSWVYVAVPALGPCYATPEVYAPIRAEIPNATALQARLFRNYQVVVASRDGVRRPIQPLLAVAAMPSLHVGGHFFFALWTWRHARRLFLPSALAALLTFLGSLVTGWHWAVDGYAGMLLAWGAIALADRWEPVPEEEREVTASSPGSPGRVALNRCG